MSTLLVALLAAPSVLACSLPQEGRVDEPARPTAGAHATPAAELERDEARRYAEHVTALRQRLPHEGFTIVVEPPFVVIGDEPPATVRSRAERTVKWAVDRLRREYFAEDPDEILDVWLFKDRASYLRHAKALFGSEPSTPFGYYSAHHRALVMNIATGGGTLVHEIVHPFVRKNFPRCPAWFNEGLGSLYEQSHENADGRIVGLTNWRLRGLQEAIRERRLPSLEKLLATNDDEFYGQGSGLHYAMARYLLYWLQEQGLLQRYWREFVAAHEQDPTGTGTLRTVIRRDDLAAFQRDWEAFVLRLRFE